MAKLLLLITLKHLFWFSCPPLASFVLLSPTGRNIQCESVSSSEGSTAGLVGVNSSEIAAKSVLTQLISEAFYLVLKN